MPQDTIILRTQRIDFSLRSPFSNFSVNVLFHQVINVKQKKKQVGKMLKNNLLKRDKIELKYKIIYIIMALNIFGGILMQYLFGNLDYFYLLKYANAQKCITLL